MFEKGIIGGICHAIYQCTKAKTNANVAKASIK